MAVAKVEARVSSLTSAGIPTNELYISGCQKELPAWGVTRQFDFGQFVMLYQVEKVEGLDVSLPIVVAPDGSLNEVDDKVAGAAQPAGGNARAVRAARSSRSTVATELLETSTQRMARTGQVPPGSLAHAVGGVPLHLALTDAKALDLVTKPPRRIVIKNLRALLEEGKVTLDRVDYYPALDSTLKGALLNGRTVNALAESRPPPSARSRTRRIALKLVPAVLSVPLDEDAIDLALATGVVVLPNNEGELRFTRDSYVDLALRSGQPVLMTADLDAPVVRPVRLVPDLLSTSTPLARQFVLQDPARWLRHPVLPAVDGTVLPVDLDGETVHALRTDRRVMLEVNGTSVEIVVGKFHQGTVPLSANVHSPSPVAAMHFATASGAISTSPSGSEMDVFPDFNDGDPNPGRSYSGGFYPGDSLPDGLNGHIIGYQPAPDGGVNPIPWPGTQPFDNLEIDPRWLDYLEFMGRVRELIGGGLADGGGGTSPAGQPPTDASGGARSRKKGLAVAVFLPWRQQWIFKGCSRGNLLSSIPLAPDESRTIRLYSWERRAKALDQSTETETEMVQDFTSTTRDTQDVFREMTTNQEFNAEAHGQLDASYSTGLASIEVGVGGSLGQESALEQVCRSTTTHMQETVRKASAKVASRRITRITESQESVSGDEVLRHIRNPNKCHTMTLDYYEQLAHYVVTTKFMRKQVKIVVLVENPLRNTKFDSLVVRTNETALRQALINAELGDAFAACRLLASYGHAWGEAEMVAAKSKQVAELDRERQKSSATGTDKLEKPPNPHIDRLLKTLNEIRAAAGPIFAADIGAALTEIADNKRPVEPANRKNGRMWLWRTLVEAKIEVSFINKLRALAQTGSTQLTPDDARSFADAIPTTTFPSLRDLNSLKDNEKEDAALSSVIRSRMWAAWDWGWWSGSVREEGLYQTDDNGIAGACDRLIAALRDYDTKASEGDALLAQEEMVNKGKEEQAAANWVDKLEMKYGLDVVADAKERQEALLAHLDAHADFYRYVLFQALPPGEQLARLTEAAPQLKVGFFEPRVVSYTGNLLALPLTPIGQSDLANLISNISSVLETAADEAAEAAQSIADDDIILPTPGLTIETSLGRCSGCGTHEEKIRDLESRQLAASVALNEGEVKRRRQRRKAGQLDDPSPDKTPMRLQVELIAPQSAVGPTPADGAEGVPAVPGANPAPRS